MAPLVQSILASTLAVVPTVELALAFSFAAPIYRMAALSRKSIATIRNANISDHWKARILPAYALNMLRTSLRLLLMLMLLAGVFALGLYAGGWLFADKFEGFRVLQRTDYELASFVIAVVYLVCRRRLKRVRLFQT